jgi:hypothetical protein
MRGGEPGEREDESWDTLDQTFSTATLSGSREIILQVNK